MIDSGCEVDLRWLEGVVCREVDGQEEYTALERAVTLQGLLGQCRSQFQVHTYRTHDGCLPVKLQMIY